MHHLCSVGKSLNLTFCVTRLVRQHLKSQQLKRGLASDPKNWLGDENISVIHSIGAFVPEKNQGRTKLRENEISVLPLEVDVSLHKPDSIISPSVVTESPDTRTSQQEKGKNFRHKSSENPLSTEANENEFELEHVEEELKSGQPKKGKISSRTPVLEEDETKHPGLKQKSGHTKNAVDKDDFVTLPSDEICSEVKEKIGKSKRTRVKQNSLPAEVELKGRMASELSVFLEENELKYEPGYNCVITSCRKLGKNVSLREETNRMYINLTTGFFVCNFCKQYGEYKELVGNTRKIIAKKIKRKEFECFTVYNHASKMKVNTEELSRLLGTGVPVEEMATEDFMKMVDLFDCKGLSRKQFERYKVRYNAKTSTLLFPCYTHVRGELVGVNQMSVTVIPPEDEESETVKKFSGVYTPQFEFNTLFGWSDNPSEKQRPKKAVLAASELDAMIISQETDCFALALPFNVKELSVHVLPSLESVDELIIWDSRDRLERGVWDINRRKKLYEKRCLVFGHEREGALNSPLQAFEKGINLTDILKTAQSMYNGGIADLGDIRCSVRAELLHKDQACGFLWTRFPILNEKLRGFRKGELTVFTGPTGSGKTTFLSEYSLDLCQQGVNTLWGSFEISNTRLVKMMLSQLALQNVQNFTEWEIDYWYDQLELLPMKFMTFHSQQNILKVMTTLEHSVYMHDIHHVIIDNLQFMMGSAYTPEENRYAKQDMVFGRLRAFATEKNCHVTLVIHPRKEKFGEPLSVQSIYGGVRASQEADNVLILQERKITPTKSKKHIEIAKNRYAGDLGVMSLTFDKETLSFSKTLKKSKKNGGHEGESSGSETSEDDYFHEM